MELDEAYAVVPERETNALTVAVPEPHASNGDENLAQPPERDLHAPSPEICTKSDGDNTESPECVTYGTAESPEYAMYECEDPELATTATTAATAATAATVYGEAASPEYEMFERAAATAEEYEDLEALLSTDRHARSHAPVPNAEPPELSMYDGDEPQSPPPTTGQNPRSPEFSIHGGEEPNSPAPTSFPAIQIAESSYSVPYEEPIHAKSPMPSPESKSDEQSEATAASVAHAPPVTASPPPVIVAGLGELFKPTVAYFEACLLELDAKATSARGFVTGLEERLQARASHLSDSSNTIPLNEAVAEELTAETSERGAYAEAFVENPPPTSEKGEGRSPAPARGSFSELAALNPAEGAGHEDYMEAWLRIDAAAAGAELTRLLEEEPGVVSDVSRTPVRQPSSSSHITMISNEESGCSSFSDWNATAIATVDMTGVEGVDCEWSDSAFDCLYEEDEGEVGDGEVLLPDDGQEETSPKV